MLERGVIVGYSGAQRVFRRLRDADPHPQKERAGRRHRAQERNRGNGKQGQTRHIGLELLAGADIRCAEQQEDAGKSDDADRDIDEEDHPPR